MTQVAALFLHIKTFPILQPYLNGASLPTLVANFVGSGESWIRSGRIVMEFFNPEGVELGIAGVMNALFVGEAYANWGLIGVAIAPTVVALPFSFAVAILLRLKKTPLVITLHIALFILYIGSVQGGFVDYIYNAIAIILIIMFLFIGGLINSGRIVLIKNRNMQYKNEY